MSTIYIKLVACRGYTHRGIDYVKDRVYPVPEAVADELLAQRTISNEAYFIEAAAPRRSESTKSKSVVEQAKEKSAARKKKVIKVGGRRPRPDPDIDDDDDGEEV